MRRFRLDTKSSGFLLVYLPALLFLVVGLAFPRFPGWEGGVAAVAIFPGLPWALRGRFESRRWALAMLALIAVGVAILLAPAGGDLHRALHFGAVAVLAAGFPYAIRFRLSDGTELHLAAGELPPEFSPGTVARRIRHVREP